MSRTRSRSKSSERSRPYVRRSEILQVARQAPTNLNAYATLLQGLDHLYRLDFANFSQARAHVPRAGARGKDPNYAAPYAFSAHWHMINVAEGWSNDTGADTSDSRPSIAVRD